MTRGLSNWAASPEIRLVMLFSESKDFSGITEIPLFFSYTEILMNALNRVFFHPKLIKKQYKQALDPYVSPSRFIDNFCFLGSWLAKINPENPSEYEHELKMAGHYLFHARYTVDFTDKTLLKSFEDVVFDKNANPIIRKYLS